MKEEKEKPVQVNLQELLNLTGWDLDTALSILHVDEKTAVLIKKEMKDTI